MARKRFTFTLEPLRTLREHAEQAAMQELARELDRAAAVRRELDRAERRVAGARAAAVSDHVTGVELSARQSYLERVERELHESRQRDDEQAASVEASRSRVQDAARERETLDRVAARRRRAFELQAARDERVASDQIALLAQQHRQGEAS